MRYIILIQRFSEILYDSEGEILYKGSSGIDEVKSTTRTYFPETWLWHLVSISSLVLILSSLFPFFNIADLFLKLNLLRNNLTETA